MHLYLCTHARSIFFSRFFFFFSDGPSRAALDDRTVWGVEVQVLLLMRRYRELAERMYADVC
jgi:hypothetical protein